MVHQWAWADILTWLARLVTTEYTQSLAEYTQSMPEYTQNLAEYAQSIPEYTQNLVEYTQSIPGYTHNMPQAKNTTKKAKNSKTFFIWDEYY